MNVAVPPTSTDWSKGCVVIAGAIGCGVTVNVTVFEVVEPTELVTVTS